MKTRKKYSEHPLVVLGRVTLSLSKGVRVLAGRMVRQAHHDARGLITLISLCLITTITQAQQERQYVRDGNKLYNEGKLNDAEEQYAKALTKNVKSPEATYDMGSVFLKQDSFEKAAHQFNAAAQLAADPKVKAKAFHNEGNSYLQAKKFEEAAEAYKNALKNNPKDDDTRYNLAYAERMLKQNPPQNRKDKNDKNKDKDKQKDEKGGQDNKDQNNNAKDNKNGQENKDPKNPKDGKNGQDQEAQKGDKKDAKEGQGRARDGLSKEEALKLLEALKSEEQKVQQKLQDKKVKPQNRKTDKDW